MSEIDPLELVVEDAVNDSLGTTGGDAIDTSDATPETPSEQPSLFGNDEPSGAAEAVPEPGVQDEFEKKWGIAATSVTGRENRIPHTRVKSMVTKAEQEGYQRALKEAEGKSTPQLAEFQTKVKDYEGRLEKVAQFEHVLENDPKTFLGLLSQIPAYKEFFAYIEKLAGQGQQEAQPMLDSASMPQPDQVLSDGSRVYSLEGLAKRDEWLASQIETRAVSQAEERFAKRIQPFEQERDSRERYAQLVPVIEKQITEARTWPNFAELEPSIIQMLKADPNISLDRAYVKAYQDQVIPKVSADRNKMRTDILAEIQRKPVSSSAPVSAVKPGSSPAGPMTMEQIIAQSVLDARTSGELK